VGRSSSPSDKAGSGEVCPVVGASERAPEASVGGVGALFALTLVRRASNDVQAHDEVSARLKGAGTKRLRVFVPKRGNIPGSRKRGGGPRFV